MIKELEEKNIELEMMCVNEKSEKAKIIKIATNERVEWNREKSVLVDLNQKLTKMLEQINSKITFHFIQHKVNEGGKKKK